MTVHYPATLTELAGGIKPTPVDVLRHAADLAAEAGGYQFLEALFAAAADDADTDLAWSPTPNDRSLDYAWVHYGASCGPIDECPCLLGAVIKAALEFVHAEIAVKEDGFDLPLILHGSHGGSVQRIGSDVVYTAPCGQYSPTMTMTGLFGAINCPGCLEALS